MKRRLLFVGPVLTASGYGVHARQLLRALVDAGDFDITVESLKWGETPFLTGPEFSWIRELVGKKLGGDPDLAIELTIPNEFKRRAPLTIGVTAGIEVDRVSPQWLLKCNAEVDAVIVPSEHSRRSFLIEYQGTDGTKLRLEKPIFVVPEGIDTSVYRQDVAEASSELDRDGGVPEKNFVFVGLGLDKPQGQDRKNVSRLIEYFCKTFPGNPNVGLILKTAIVNGSTADFEITKKRIADIKASTGCGEFPKIRLIHGRLQETELAAIYRDPRVVAAISLTHGEGFGLPLIEAAACGIPVMATDWSGHLDFLTKDGKKLFVPFEHTLEELHPNSVWEGVLEAGTRWATVKEPDVQTKLRKMVLSSETPRKWARELAVHVATNYNLARVGQVFVDLIRKGVEELDQHRPPSNPAEFLRALKAKVREQGPCFIYTMPMSAGDVFLSTGVIKGLRRLWPSRKVYLATSPQYMDIVRDLKDGDGPLIDEVIPWQPWMQDVSALEEVFGLAFTPNLAVQMTWSNWIRGGHGRNLIDEFGIHCGLPATVPGVGFVNVEQPVFPETKAYDFPSFPDDDLELTPSPRWIAVHAGGQKSARAWSHWKDLVASIRAQDYKVVQVGAADDIDVGQVDLDLRGKTDHKGLVSVFRSPDVDSLVCIDSYPMHVASQLNLTVVAIFGSSYPSSTGPKVFLPVLQPGQAQSWTIGQIHPLSTICIETKDRNGCERACYKDTCRVDPGNPCINNIDPRDVFAELGFERDSYKEYWPKIAGYTHILNPRTHGYPFVQSIRSMLGFCDEVIVVDGGSTDGSAEDVKAIGDPRIKVLTNPWDPEEPGMDGMQKAFGRAMVSPDVEFLWQQDADEVVHEDDYAKVRDICKRFPTDVDIVHLPVVELWGDQKHCRTDRHSWKWRLSRNNLRVTHGINIHARQVDQKTGRIYAKPGMSDGCEYIDMMTGEMLPHRGFYNQELDRIRQTSPVEYGRAMNDVFKRLPCVWHYSWADLPRKIRNFKEFWSHQWSVLYQTPNQERFPDVKTDDDVMRKAAELRLRGGEHGPATLFDLEKSPPKSMEGWGEVSE